MIFEGRNYQDILKSAFEDRCKSNSRYSLRAFARDLGLSPSTLSEVLTHKKGLSKVLAKKVAGSIGLNKKENELFCDLVESQHARSKSARGLAKTRIQKHLKEKDRYKTLTLDAFKVVSEWHHFAITQIIELKTFKNSHAWIAKVLGISKIEVEKAIERLKRLEILKEKKGKLQTTSEYFATPDGVPSDAIKKWHKQVLQKAASAIDSQGIDERDFSAVFFPINRKDIPEVKKKIKKFRRELCKEFGSSKSPDEVYSLGVQFFKVSNTQGVLK